MSNYNYKSAQAKKIIKHVKDYYGAEPEFLWLEKIPAYPSFSVFRRSDNKKWFGILMSISGNKLGFNSDQEFEILNVKFGKGEALDFVESSHDKGIRPAYHMNKQNWITIILDESRLSDEAICKKNNWQIYCTSSDKTTEFTLKF